jgi:hypothetical protein
MLKGSETGGELFAFYSLLTCCFFMPTCFPVVLAPPWRALAPRRLITHSIPCPRSPLLCTGAPMAGGGSAAAEGPLTGALPAAAVVF